MIDAREAQLTIAQLARLTGLPPATLRMWESRHGFPAPMRGPGGHRRYSQSDAERVRRVAALRSEGMSLPAAIERTLRRPPPSLFAALRTRLPEAAPALMPKPTVLALSRAIEDEHCARGGGGLLLGSFQRERFYRRSEPRWSDLARTSQLTVALADFPGLATGPGGIVEFPIDRRQPLSREWTVISSVDSLRACLAAWEPPVGSGPAADDRRRFEVLWSFDPAVVAEAVVAASRLVEERDPGLAARLELAAGPAVPPAEAALSAGGSLAQRMVGYLATHGAGRP